MSALDIAAVHAWEALDSRGRPTVGCRVELTGGGVGRAIVPSGASTGSHEAREARDGGTRYGGAGVRGAVEAVNTIYARALAGRSAADRVAIDDLIEDIDGEPGFARLGGNAALAVSLGVALANAEGQGVALWRTLEESTPLLPMPMVNVISGGAHAGRAIDLQDCLVVPLGATSFAQAMEWTWAVRRACAQLVDERGGWSALVADEGGLAGRFETNEQALRLVTAGIERAGFAPGTECGIAIDVAASQLTVDGAVHLSRGGGRLEANAWLEVLRAWVERYPIVSLEDILDEDQWADWSRASALFADLQVLGDDLFATDVSRLERGIANGVANAVLVKVNQAGTVTRAERVVRRAHEAGYATVVSARSGDTEDSWLADLAVGWRAGQIKVGSTMRSERTAKWNRLLELESDGGCVYAGAPARDGGGGMPSMARMRAVQGPRGA